MLHLTSLHEESCNMLQSFLRWARQIPLDKGLMWSLVILAPKSVEPVQLGTSYSHIMPTGPLQQCHSFSCLDIHWQEAWWWVTSKASLLKLGLNHSLYSGHSMCIWVTTMAGVAGLRDWEIKSLGCWKSSTYQTYIRETSDMKINCTKRMALPQHPSPLITAGQPS